MPDGRALSCLSRPDYSEKGEQCLLSEFEIFADLRFREIVAIEQQCRYRRFSANEHVLERESPSTEMYFIVRGCVRLVNFSLSGREITFDERKAGDYFGEISAVDGKPRFASVVSIDDSLILALTRRAFMEVLAAHHPIALRVMCRLADSVRLASNRIMDLSTLAAQNRVQAELLRQAEMYKSRANTAVIEPIPIHSDIASRVSTTRETVARVLNDLARKGIVERRRHALIVHDMRRLQEIISEVRG